MKLMKTFAIGVALSGLAACHKSPSDAAANNVAAAADNQADAIKADAKNEAKAVKAEGENEADEIRHGNTAGVQ